MDDLDRLYQRLLDAVREGAPHLRERRFRLGDIPLHLLPYRLHRRELGFESVQQYERALARLAAGERGYLSADAGVHEAFRRAAADPATPVDQLLRTYGDAAVAIAPDSRHRADAPAATDGSDGHTAEMAVPEGAAAAPAAPPSGPTSAPVSAPVSAPASAPAPVAPPAAAAAEGAPAPAPPTDGPTVRYQRAGTPAVAPTAASPGAEPSSDAMPFPVRPPAQVAGGPCPHCGRPLPTERAVTFCPHCGENLTVRRCPACSTELEAGWRFCITCGREGDAPAEAAAPA
jgi:predicted RNA-binding Zn-ribbon protein involved in translation (DUF1610 family)